MGGKERNRSNEISSRFADFTRPAMLEKGILNIISYEKDAPAPNAGRCFSGPSAKKECDLIEINFQCGSCKKNFTCDVGSVDIDDETFRPIFSNKIVCPRCGERSLDDVFLTELGQSHLTEATFDSDGDDGGDEDGGLWGESDGECIGCDGYFHVNDIGLCDECAKKLDRDLIRQRDWSYSTAAYGLDPLEREELRKIVIAKYGASHELFSSATQKKNSSKKRKKTGGGRKKKGR